MQEEWLVKFNRVLAILLRLQSQKFTKVEYLAEYFQVSKRTIYRDIKILNEIGIPVLSETGKGYYLMDGFKSSTLPFSEEELISLAASEALLKKHLIKQLQPGLTSALDKIKVHLRTQDKSMNRQLLNLITIRHQDETKEQPSGLNGISNIIKSVTRQRQVMLTYQSSTYTTTQRMIEPLGILQEYTYWYVIAYCHLRKDYRQFRTDRIITWKALDIPFSKQHGILQDYIAAKDYSSDNLNTIILQVPIQFAPLLKPARTYFGFKKEIVMDQVVEMHFEANVNCPHFSRWIFSYSDIITSLTPRALKDKMTDMLANYQKKLGAIAAPN